MATVLKFGGSSVATAQNIKEQVVPIILENAFRNRVFVVVSALGGVTNQLIECARLAADDHGGYKKIFDEIADRHRALINELLGMDINNLLQESRAHQSIEKILLELENVLNSIRYLHDNYGNALDLVASFGERLSATIIAAYLDSITSARFVDARNFMFTNDEFTQAKVLYEITSNEIRNYFLNFFRTEGESTIPVVTGFIGVTKDNHTTTLGRDGSNCTAAMLAASLPEIEALLIFSDVNGVYTADPRLIASCQALDKTSYPEAKEMSDFFAKVIRMIIIPPLIERNIPVTVKNTFNPTAPGTKISLETNEIAAIKNISIKPGLLILTLSPIQFNISNLTERLLRTLTLAGIHFSLVTQAVNAYDVAITLNQTDLQKVQQLIEHEFLYEFQQNLLATNIVNDMSLLALIGHGVRESLSLLGKVFITLDDNHIPLKGIAHGTSACNISLILPTANSLVALKAIHDCIFNDQKELLKEGKKKLATEKEQTVAARGVEGGFFGDQSIKEAQKKPHFEAEPPSSTKKS